MSNLVDLWSETQPTILSDDSTPALVLKRTTAAANATLALLELAPASTASVAVIGLKNTSFVSAVSIVFAAGANWAGLGAVRVVRTDGTFGWIPVLPDGVVTAAAVA